MEDAASAPVHDLLKFKRSVRRVVARLARDEVQQFSSRFLVLVRQQPSYLLARHVVGADVHNFGNRVLDSRLLEKVLLGHPPQFVDVQVGRVQFVALVLTETWRRAPEVLLGLLYIFVDVQS